jgi:DNA (cytosine-5)-methyltransferase 1
LCGGFPCQDVSAAGKQAGIKDGTRSGLWSVFAEAIDILRPPIVIIENVRGLLSAQAHRNVESEDPVVGNGAGRPVLRAAGAVLVDLADIGYDAAWTTLAAGDIGAPHRRERVFIVATSDATGYRWDEGRPEPTRKQRGSDAAVSGDGNGLSLELQRLNRMLKPESRWTPEEVAALLPTPRSSDCFGAGLHGDGGMDLRTTVTLLPTPSTFDGGGSTLHPDRRKELNPKHSPELSELARHSLTQWGKYEPAIRRWEQLTRPAPAPTEPNKNGNPRLAAAFSEWLMGWPEGWVTDPAIGISRNDQLRIVGNGVCQQQAAAALRYLLTVAAQ